MEKLTISIDTEEKAFVKSQLPGHVRRLIQADMGGIRSTPFVDPDVAEVPDDTAGIKYGGAVGPEIKDPVQAMREQMKDMGITTKDKVASNLFDSEEESVYVPRTPPYFPTCTIYKNNPAVECSSCKGRPECEETYG
jgi:hypothetical protein